jgi:hypothetical protein
MKYAKPLATRKTLRAVMQEAILISCLACDGTTQDPP